MISVVLSTHNGQDSLPRMFDALSRVTPPSGGWKLVVVENASSDATPEILSNWQLALPMTVVTEPTPGKNRALNRALEHVEGDFVVFTDDDVLPDPDWLVRYRQVVDGHPDFDVFGGRIVGEWERLPPAWLQHRKYLEPLFAITDPAQDDGPVDPGMVWGPNMAVRTRVFKAAHRFDESVGPDGTATYTMGSETEFVHRLARAGYRSWFSNAPSVAHIIPAHAVRVPWMLNRAERFGRAQVRSQLTRGQRGQSPPTLFGLPRWMLRCRLELSVRISVARVLRRDEAWFAGRWELGLIRGRMAEWRRQRRSNVEP